MTIEERAIKTDAILNALSSGRTVQHILQERSKATHNDLSYVEEQHFVSVDRSGLALSTIMFLLEPRGRDVINAGGLLAYLENVRLDKQKLLDKSELERQIDILQHNKLLFDQTIRDKDIVIKSLQDENLRISTRHLTNQVKIFPTEKATKQLQLFRAFLGIVVLLMGVILQYTFQLVEKLVALLP